MCASNNFRCTPLSLSLSLSLCITRDKAYFMEDSSVLKSNFGNEEMSHDNSEVKPEVNYEGHSLRWGN